MKPSEKIHQRIIHRMRYEGGVWNDYKWQSILDYLDEEYEKKVVEKRKREETGERF